MELGIEIYGSILLAVLCVIFIGIWRSFHRPRGRHDRWKK